MIIRPYRAPNWNDSVDLENAIFFRTRERRFTLCVVVCFLGLIRHVADSAGGVQTETAQQLYGGRDL